MDTAHKAGRIEKAELERLVAEDLIRHLLPDVARFVESRNPPQPDVVVNLQDGRSIGIEVCSLIDERQLEASEHQRRFLAELNEVIDSRQWPPVCVRLVMQDDRETVIHRPAPGFESYRLLPSYLDGLFVHPYVPAAGRFTVELNQWSSRRPARGLFPRSTEVPAFAKELTRYVLALQESDYRLGWEGQPRFHHAVVAEMSERRPVEYNDSPKVALLEKLNGRKTYERNQLVELYLLVHNRPQDPGYDLMAWHDYWHDRERILDWVRLRVADAAASSFDAVYFADYSEVLGKCRIHRLGP